MKCTHPYLIKVDDFVGEYMHPVECEECSQIIECPHLEIDNADDFNQPTCIDCLACGIDVLEPIEYDKYQEKL